MKNTKKRLATATLAGAMALSLAVPAFAAAQSTKVTATYQEIAINVTVPTTADITINPLGMPVAIKSAVEEDTDAGITAEAAIELSDQLVSVPKTIVNNCTMDIIVNANVTGTVKGNLKFATTAWDKAADPTSNEYKYADSDDADAKKAKDNAKKIATTAQANEKGNTAFVFLEMVKVASNSAIMGETDDPDTEDVDETKVIDETKLATVFASEITWNVKDLTALYTPENVLAATKGTAQHDDEDDAEKITGYDDDAIIVLSTKAAENPQAGLVRLAAADRTTGAVNDGGIALMRLGGQVSVKPTKGWAKTDGFGATIAYTFTAEKPAT